VLARSTIGLRSSPPVSLCYPLEPLVTVHAQRRAPGDARSRDGEAREAEPAHRRTLTTRRPVIPLNEHVAPLRHARMFAFQGFSAFGRLSKVPSPPLDRVARSRAGR
jgi:hypothetical protein